MKVIYDSEADADRVSVASGGAAGVGGVGGRVICEYFKGETSG